MTISVSCGPATQRVPGGYTRRSGYKVQAIVSKGLSDWKVIGLYDTQHEASKAVHQAVFGWW